MRIRAEYRRQGTIIRTRFYSSSEDAQDALAKRIGHFHYLGRVCGDAHEAGFSCESAPRNGGLVSLEIRSAQEPLPSRYTQRCQLIEEHGRLTSENE
jgi:hypothetical protein